MSYETEQEKLKSSNEKFGEATSRINPKTPKFHAILCPKSANPISISECSQCPHKEEYHRSHKIGITLNSMICKFQETQEH